jgi:hypothetical protein
MKGYGLIVIGIVYYQGVTSSAYTGIIFCFQQEGILCIAQYIPISAAVLTKFSYEMGFVI